MSDEMIKDGPKNEKIIKEEIEKNFKKETEDFESENKNGGLSNKTDVEVEMGSKSVNQNIDEDDLNSFTIISECGENDSQSMTTDDDNSVFIFDTNPMEEKSVGYVPLFKRSRKCVLKEQEEFRNEGDDMNTNKIKNMCFNCDGDHSLKDCELPRNMKKINKARKLKNMKAERYHVDVEQRFAHIKPGKISEKLSSALGLRNNEVPPMFYRMRVLKYPPAWLEEAKVAHSGITLFGSKGCTILGSDDDEGELDESKLKYDLSKIISFPGFNIYPGGDYFDDYSYQGVPPFSIQDSKEKFIESFALNAAKQGYKRKKLKIDIEAVENCILDVETNLADMEVDENELEKYQNSFLPLYLRNQPPPPAEEPPPIPPPPEEERELSVKDFSKTCDSNVLVDTNYQELSLSALEMKQAEILKLLNSADGKQIEENSKLEIENSAGKFVIEENEELCHIDKNNENGHTSQRLCHQNDSLDENITENNDKIKLNEKSKNEILKDSIVGTPILKFSPYDKLPPGHLFKEGVSDVINFENLPDSVGKYDHMRVLLYGVRKKIIEINQMPDD